MLKGKLLPALSAIQCAQSAPAMVHRKKANLRITLTLDIFAQFIKYVVEDAYGTLDFVKLCDTDSSAAFS